MKIYSEEILKRKYAVLSRKAEKAINARNNLERALERLQSNKNLWEQFCKSNGSCADSNVGDWMC